jgi:ftsJ-like methyltransferase
MKKNRSKTSAVWMREHVSDVFVHRAKKEGYRSRAAYKLLEIDAKDHLLFPGARVVDLGSAPGSWSQVAAAKVGKMGKVIAVDILPMEPLKRVEFIHGNFMEEDIWSQLENCLANKLLDLVICDIAPSISGVALTDQARAYYLAELALFFAERYLGKEGRFLVKVFHGAGYEDYVRRMKERFEKVVVRKPHASRDRSKEVYLLASRLHYSSGEEHVG